MHFGGWIGERYKAAEHKVDHTLKHYDEVLRSHDAPDMYVGVSSTDDGTSWNPNIKIESNNQVQGTSYNPKPRPNSGYSRTTAATAKDIAQGGMTKDEVIEFNMKHPNETAKRSE